MPSSAPSSSSSASPSACGVSSCRWLLVAAYASPVALLGVMVFVYWLAPGFYLAYILEEKHRETQAVEIFTFTASITAAGLLFWSAIRLWRTEWYDGRVPGWPGGPMIILTAAMATFFFAGEEISCCSMAGRMRATAYRSLSASTSRPHFWYAGMKSASLSPM